MAKKISVALVIATYNWPEALRLVLESVLQQRVMPDEVIIADDGSGMETKNLIDSFKERFPVPLKHFWHPDNGFRKTYILNRAIAGTECDYIIQVDGDIVLHPRFVEDHITAAEEGFYIRGSRVLLADEKSVEEIAKGKISTIFPFSANIKNRINALRLPFLAPLIIKKSKRSDNVSGCNTAFWRQDFVKVNGYNNEICGWGHEDIELAARFVNIGVAQKKVKMMAVCYHLYHTIADRQRENHNYTIYMHTLQKGIRFCSQGFNKYHQQYG